LQLRDPTPQQLRGLCAWLTWAAAGGSDGADLHPRLGRVQQFLEKHEPFLPVRAVWLAWTSLVKLSQGDVLALARARDRLLERLYQHGLSPEFDLPGFLRLTGPRAGDRLQAVRAYLLRLRDLAHAWVSGPTADKTLSPKAPGTRDYADLIFAFGLACMNEATQSQKLAEPAAAALDGRDV